jgi:hypothetical protein
MKSSVPDAFAASKHFHHTNTNELDFTGTWPVDKREKFLHAAAA